MDDRDQREMIVDAALSLADEVGWEGVRLHAVADRLGIALAEVQRHYPDLDAVGNELFVRANRAMLVARDEPGFGGLPARERLHRALARWFETLGPQQASVRTILRYKLQPAHIHLQAGAVVGLSRTVQWLREAAGLDAAGRRKEREEVGLTLLFLATLAYWLADRSPGQENSLRFLRRRLDGPWARRAWPDGEATASQPRDV